MDSYHDNLQHEPTHSDRSDEPDRDLVDDDDIALEPPPLGVVPDERRMQVRAYNYWTSLLGDRPFPQIEDLALAPLPDFADHAVVLDFSVSLADPAITMLGKKLAEECGTAAAITRLSDVSPGSLLSRITDRYLQISTDAAPTGFEAEFASQRGTTLLCRGILLPFSGDGENIAHLMGVINWKELADPILVAELRHEFADAVVAARSPASDAQLSAWADGPIALKMDPVADATDAKLAAARAAAAAARDLEERSLAALYTAIGHAWDLALAAEADPAAFHVQAPHRSRSCLAACTKRIEWPILPWL